VTLAALVLAIAVGAAVQVVSGFGFGLVAAPVLVAFTDPVNTVSVLAVLGVVVGALTLLTSREPLAISRTSPGLLAWAVPGLVTGAIAVSALPADAVRAAVGVLVLAALAQRRFLPPQRRHIGQKSRPRWLGLAAAGCAAGAMSTSTGLNGPPLVLFLTARNVPTRVARDTLALLFLVLDAAAIAALVAFGNFALPAATLALPVAGLVGVLAGHAIFDRLSEPARAAAVTATLVASACVALGATLV
jgi:uncharacterized protein